MLARLSPSDCGAAFSRAVERGLIQPELDTAVIFHDLDRLRARLKSVLNFLGDGVHTVAIKANPLLGVLRVCVEEGFGLEAASWEEVELALASGCDARKIFFDSPVKTKRELEAALSRGVMLNADSFAELDAIASVLRGCNARSRVGLRINPLVGLGAIAPTSVGDAMSRFGVSIAETEEIIKRFANYHWLTGLHAHVGSQGIALAQLVQSAKRLVELGQIIREHTGRAVALINLGGGLPTVAPFDSVCAQDCPPPPTLETYAAALRSQTPELWSQGYTIATEFGRWVHGSCGWAVSRIESVKRGQVDVISTHLGADFALRTAYHRRHWPIEFVAIAPNGTVKNTPQKLCTICGPLCFAGDVLAESLSLPSVSVGDYLLFRDVGAYTLSMWSRHCSRAMPLVLGVSEQEFTVLKLREHPEALVELWGGVATGGDRS